MKFIDNLTGNGVISIILLFFVSCAERTADTTIYVDAARVENRITPWLYGACIEDVNHEIYGGLYDQKIFGESFEEPVHATRFNEFSVYEGDWTYENGEIAVNSGAGYRLIYNSVEISTGSIETDIKFDSRNGHNAGILIYVSEPGKGPDTFYGYEISLFADGSKLSTGIHKNNYTHISDCNTQVNPLEWNKLKVTMKQGKFRVFLNGRSIVEMNTVDEALLKGRIALRTWNSKVRYRNMKIKSEDREIIPSFTVTPPLHVSEQWDALVSESAKAAFALDENDAYNGKNSQIIEFVSGEGSVGISNASLNRWGISVEKNQKFAGRLYMKTHSPNSSVTVALQSADGKNEYAAHVIKDIAGQWTKYPFELTSNTKDENARFAIYLDKPLKLWIDQVTLMTTGNKQFKSLPLRHDIAQAMAEQGITFLRYGGTMINAAEYRFKKMIGDRDKRPPYTGHWYKYSTNGFGIEDFISFCEAAGFTPAFAINIEETPQDVADMIEYLNGSAKSEWGSKRAENGHLQPYSVKYVEIGNEEALFNGDRDEDYEHYIKRFNMLYEAIHAKDSNISVICSAWWRPESHNMEKVFKALDGKAEYWDYHPWTDQLNAGKQAENELKQMKELFHKWNPDTKMKCAIFEENNNTHNMQRTLGHVALQNAVRRMGDFVLASCAANALQPYKQNDNGWDQGQIFFTPAQVWGMPPYYAQQMASNNHQPLLVYSSVENNLHELDVTATRSEDSSKLVLHIVNTENKPVPVNLAITNFDRIVSAKSLTLSGELNGVNTPKEPAKISPVEKIIKNESNQIYMLEPYSYTVIVYSK
jgi:alpha-L-arabinofuranosidase